MFLDPFIINLIHLSIRHTTYKSLCMRCYFRNNDVFERVHKYKRVVHVLTDQIRTLDRAVLQNKTIDRIPTTFRTGSYDATPSVIVFLRRHSRIQQLENISLHLKLCTFFITRLLKFSQLQDDFISYMMRCWWRSLLRTTKEIRIIIYVFIMIVGLIDRLLELIVCLFVFSTF